MFKPTAVAALALAVLATVAVHSVSFAEELGKNTTETTTTTETTHKSKILGAPGAIVRGTYHGTKRVAVGTKNGVGKVFRMGRKKSTEMETETKTETKSAQ